MNALTSDGRAGTAINFSSGNINRGFRNLKRNRSANLSRNTRSRWKSAVISSGPLVALSTEESIRQHLEDSKNELLRQNKVYNEITLERMQKQKKKYDKLVTNKNKTFFFNSGLDLRKDA